MEKFIWGVIGGVVVVSLIGIYKELKKANVHLGKIAKCSCKEPQQEEAASLNIVLDGVKAKQGT